ncbi:MAG: hypothetical protein Q9227_007058 [Pyrenula ochraceoflavens]
MNDFTSPIRVGSKNMNQSWHTLGEGPSTTTTTASESSSLPAYAQDEQYPPFKESFEKNVNLELRRETPVAHVTENPTEPREPFLTPEHASPGIASESALRRGLQIPTRSKTITSGFPYVEALSDAGVGEQEWSTFTSEITQIARMTSGQWTTTVGKGLGTLVVGGLVVGVLGVVPAAMVARLVRQRTEARNVHDARRDGAQLQLLVEQWNETYFRSRGILVRIDLPGEADDMGIMDISTSKIYHMERRGSEKDVVAPKKVRAVAENDRRAREKAARRGRIVILPLDNASETSISEQREHDRESSEYEAKSGMKDFYPDEPKP